MFFKKKFVSVYISSSKIQLAQLSSDKKRLFKSISVDTPQGLIANSKVTDVQKLSETLSLLWKKGGIKEKTIGIIIPELATLTKTFDLPKLEEGDIDEAVRWHAADFLPEDIGNFILDWEFVGESEAKMVVTVVAVRKETLEGYTKASEKAGLLPFLVETPSITLFDHLKDGKKKALVVCGGADGFILGIGGAGAILGTSFINPKSLDELLASVGKMVNYFSSVSLESVFIGGQIGFSGVIAGLEKALSLKAEDIAPLLTGVSKEATHKLLIPILSQFTKLSDPSDVRTINLLPPDLSARYEKERLKLRAWSLTLFVTLLSWFSFMSTAIVYFYLSSRASLLPSQEFSGAVSKEEVALITEVKNINSLSQKVLKITEATHSPETILNSIYEAKPNGVSLNNYFIDLESGDIRISGISATRVSLIDFKYKIEENENFSLVSIPVTSFEQEKDFDFEMNFSFLPVKGTKLIPN